MRVLWVGHNLAYPPKGGVSQRNYNLLRQVGKHHEVHVLAFDQPATRPKGVSPQDCVEALGRFCARVEWMPLQRHNTGFLKYVLAARACLSRTPYAMRWLSSPALVGRLGTILGNTHFDVVHFDTLALAPYLPYVYRSAVVLNHHNIESVMMERRASLERNPIRRCYFHSEVKKLRAAEHRWCPRFDLNLVVSEEEGELLSNRTNDVSWLVVANGVDVAYFRHESQPHGP